MVTATTNELFWGLAKFLADAEGTEPVSEVGYTFDGSNITITSAKDIQEERVNEFDLPVDVHRGNGNLQAALTLSQLNPTTLAYALGLSANTNEVTIGRGLSDIPAFAVRIVGTLKNGGPIHMIATKAKVMNDFTLETGKNAQANLPIEFAILDGTTDGALFKLNRTASTITISSGALTRTQAATPNGIAHVHVGGEGGAADTLNSITGSGLTNLEIIRLQLSSIAEPITITHSAEDIVLKGAADFVMTKLGDWIDLYYHTAGTAWKEITRYDAP